MNDPRPTQLEVDAKAAEMFGEGWKRHPEQVIAQCNAHIARHLDMARDAVIKERP